MTPTRIYFSVKPSLCKLNKLVVLPFRVTATTETFRLHNTTKSLRSFTRWSKYSLVDWVIISSHFIMRVISSGVCVFIVVVFLFLFFKGCSGPNRDVSIICTRMPWCSCATIRSKRPSPRTGTPAATKTATMKRRRRRRSWTKRVSLSLSLEALKTQCCIIY